MTDKYEGLIDAEGYIDYNYFYNLLAEVKRLREENGIIEWAKATHPVWLNNLKEGYKRHMEMKE